jgi:hypothetical protein
MEESGRPRLPWTQELPGSNPGYPTRNSVSVFALALTLMLFLLRSHAHTLSLPRRLMDQDTRMRTLWCKFDSCRGYSL